MGGKQFLTATGHYITLGSICLVKCSLVWCRKNGTFLISYAIIELNSYGFFSSVIGAAGGGNFCRNCLIEN